MYVCLYVCMHACMHVCMYVCMHVCMYACMHVCLNLSVCLSIHPSCVMYTHAHTHTHVHEHTDRAAPTKPSPSTLDRSILHRQQWRDRIGGLTHLPRPWSSACCVYLYRSVYVSILLEGWSFFCVCILLPNHGSMDTSIDVYATCLAQHSRRVIYIYIYIYICIYIYIYTHIYIYIDLCIYIYYTYIYI